MPISQLLFSFNGRINRAKWWLTGLAILVVMVALVALGFLAASMLGALAIVLLVLYLPLLWVGLALAAKRLHDRDKSAWWLLVFYVLPGMLQGIATQLTTVAFLLNLAGLAITIWAIVELGFLRGTSGPNQYGPDPLQQA